MRREPLSGVVEQRDERSRGEPEQYEQHAEPTHPASDARELCSSVPTHAARRMLLVPDLDLVTIGIPHESIPAAGRKFAPRAYRAAGALDGNDRRVDVLWPQQAESEMDDPAGYPSVLRVAFEGDHVVRPGAQHLYRVRVAVVLPDAEDGAIELERTRRALHRKGDVREAVRGERSRPGHRNLSPVRLVRARDASFRRRARAPP